MSLRTHDESDFSLSVTFYPHFRDFSAAHSVLKRFKRSLFWVLRRKPRSSSNISYICVCYLFNYSLKGHLILLEVLYDAIFVVNSGG